MTNPTPGPWAFDGENSANQGFDVALPDGGVLATAYYYVDRNAFSVDQAEANAYLIAAAPALLAACEMLIDDPGITAGANEVLKAAVAPAQGDTMSDENKERFLLELLDLLAFYGARVDHNHDAESLSNGWHFAGEGWRVEMAEVHQRQGQGGLS